MIEGIAYSKIIYNYISFKTTGLKITDLGCVLNISDKKFLRSTLTVSDATCQSELQKKIFNLTSQTASDQNRTAAILRFSNRSFSQVFESYRQLSCGGGVAEPVCARTTSYPFRF